MIVLTSGANISEGHMKHRAPLVALTLTLLASSSTAQGSAPAVPLEPVPAILDAFQSHDIVALGEPHMIEQGHALRVALVKDPRFPRLVNDIVWECGSARDQGVMDRFMTGENVSDAELRETWRNTVGSINIVCDLPIYEAFIREVKAINDRLPAERKIRVLLGDPPVDWSVIKTVQELMPWAEQRDTHAVNVINREVIAKNRRALVIYGDGRFPGRACAQITSAMILARWWIASATILRQDLQHLLGDVNRPGEDPTGYPVVDRAETRAPERHDARRDGFRSVCDRREWRLTTEVGPAWRTAHRHSQRSMAHAPDG